jgi:hypothetical protein
LRLDWSDFCHDICRGPAGLVLSAWQRLSNEIIKQDRLKFVRAISTPPPTLFLDGKFHRGFSVALALTLRALAIKGVSPANMARTEQSLQLLQTACTPATKFRFSSKTRHQTRLDLVTPVPTLSQRLQQQPKELSPPKSLLSCKPGDLVAPIRSNSFSALSKSSRLRLNSTVGAERRRASS